MKELLLPLWQVDCGWQETFSSAEILHEHKKTPKTSAIAYRTQKTRSAGTPGAFRLPQPGQVVGKCTSSLCADFHTGESHCEVPPEGVTPAGSTCPKVYTGAVIGQYYQGTCTTTEINGIYYCTCGPKMPVGAPDPNMKGLTCFLPPIS